MMLVCGHLIQHPVLDLSFIHKMLPAAAVAEHSTSPHCSPVLHPVLVQHLPSTGADKAQPPSVPDCPAGFAPESAGLTAATIALHVPALQAVVLPHAILPVLLWLL